MVLTMRPKVVRALATRSAGEPLENHVGARYSVAQAGRQPYQLVPLFAE
jgi:hypothetical protein